MGMENALRFIQPSADSTEIHPGQFRHHNHELTWIEKHKHVERSFLKVNI